MEKNQNQLKIINGRKHLEQIWLLLIEEVFWNFHTKLFERGYVCTTTSVKTFLRESGAGPLNGVEHIILN